MKMIDISLVKRYVEGEDIGQYSIEELENDIDFMISVISYTNDIKMYALCSENLKRNYEFVKYLVLKFQDKTDFIMSVANYYLDNTDTDWEKIELGIIMEKILPVDLSDEYSAMNRATYSTKRVEIELSKAENSNLKNMVEMGFWFFFDQYNGNELILDYYANCLLEEIIRDNDIDFEKMMHKQFKSVDKITEVGVNNYIVNFVSHYDSMLSSYISTHINIVKSIADKIKRIKNNWNLYLSKDEAKRYNNMISMVHYYMQMVYSDISELDMIYYVATELGIEEKVKQYDGTKELENEFDMNLYYSDKEMNELVKSEIENNFKERLIYLKVKNIMTDQLFSDEPYDLYSLIDAVEKQTDEPKKCKIININLKDKKE